MNSSLVSAGDITKTTQYNNLRKDAPYTGCIINFPIDTPPTGWLACDGSAVSRITYASLFAVIGTNYGVGDGVNTFNLPDSRGKHLLGKTVSTNLGDTTSGSHVITANEMPYHRHVINDYSHNHTTWNYNASGTASPTQNRAVVSNSAGNANTTSSAGSHNHGGVTGAIGSGVAITMEASYYSMGCIIKI
jgi:microcystin-dependent protein